MNKKVFLLLSLVVVLVGGYFIGNYTFNKILVNKVENVLKSDKLQKEIDKLTQSDNIEKELSFINTEDKPKEIETKEDPPKENNAIEETLVAKDKKEPESPIVHKATPAPTAQTEPKAAVVEEDIKEETEQKNDAESEQIEFATKNEAIEFVKNRFTPQEIAELYKIYSEAVKDGLTAEEKKALKEKAYEEAIKKFTPQEIAALKKIILGES